MVGFDSSVLWKVNHKAEECVRSNYLYNVNIPTKYEAQTK